MFQVADDSFWPGYKSFNSVEATMCQKISSNTKAKHFFFFNTINEGFWNIINFSVFGREKNLDFSLLTKTQTYLFYWNALVHFHHAVARLVKWWDVFFSLFLCFIALANMNQANIIRTQQQNMATHFQPFLIFTVAFVDCGMNNNNSDKRNKSIKPTNKTTETMRKSGRSKIIHFFK